MKKALIYTLSLAMLLSALTACGSGPDQGQTSEPKGPADAVSAAPQDSPKAVASEEEVCKLVLETNPGAKIAAVVSFDVVSWYQYDGSRFLVDSGTVTGLSNLSDSVAAQLSAFNEVNAINHSTDGQGYLIFLEGEALPSYYVEEGKVWITRSGLVGDTNKYWMVFPVRDEEMLGALQDTLSQAKGNLSDYADKLEQLQYFISGSVEELNEEYHYILLNGTAEQYSSGDFYQGKIRLDYSKEGEEWFAQDNIYGVAAFSWRDEEIHDDGEWNGYKGFSSAKESFLGYSLERTYKSIEGNVDFYLKILRNIPPLQGIDYEETLSDWLLRFTVPEEWKDICDIETAENVVSFYQKASRAEMGGLLFDLAVMEGTGYLEIPHYEIVAEEEGVTLLAVFPTDVQFDGNAMAEYEEMQARIVEILDSVEFERK